MPEVGGKVDFKIDFEKDDFKITIDFEIGFSKSVDGKKKSTFFLENAIEIGSYRIQTVLAGTRKKDKITGTSDNEILTGCSNKDKFVCF